MVAVDFIGLILTICIVGLRYPHYVLAAAFIHEAGRILMALFLHGQIDTLVAAGAFGIASIGNLGSGAKLAMVVFAGPLANYIVSSTAGGVEFERTTHLLNPFAILTHPFAVVNLRLALVSCLVNIWQFL